MGADRMSIGHVTKCHKQVFNIAWDTMIGSHVTFPRARLQKSPVAFRTFECPNLCTRISIWCVAWNDACGIIWGVGRNIINRCLHGISRKLGLGVAQIQKKSIKVSLQLFSRIRWTGERVMVR